MNTILSQTAEHSISGVVGADFFCRLPSVICEYTKLNYFCEQTEKGCFLKPTFRNMPYGNSFVPEIDMVITKQDGQSVLRMTGRPVKFARVFMSIWFGFLGFLEVFLLVLAAISWESEMVPMLIIPVIMGVFGYLLCTIATKLTFQSVVKAIKQSFF